MRMREDCRSLKRELKNQYAWSSFFILLAGLHTVANFIELGWYIFAGVSIVAFLGMLWDQTGRHAQLSAELKYPPLTDDDAV